EVGSEVVPEGFAVVVVETSHGRDDPDFSIVSVRKRHGYGSDPDRILVENLHADGSRKQSPAFAPGQRFDAEAGLVRSDRELRGLPCTMRRKTAVCCQS